jgi:two-component system sensor histidine kinase DegS
MPPIFGGAAAARAAEAAPGYELGDRFHDRAGALFYARLAFLAIGLGVLAVPSWSSYLGATSRTAFLVYFAVIGYSVTNYLLLDHPRFGRPLTFATLILDLVTLGAVVMASGGLESPIMAAQVMFTIFFAVLFPRFVSMVPPLLMLPVVARLDLWLAGGDLMGRKAFLLVWYTALNAIAVYVMIYLNRRDNRHLAQLRDLTSMREEAIITEERLRLAREIHDGLGGEMSSLIIQAEFIQRLAKDERLQKEVTELKTQAEEAMDELRRSLTMMRRDFDLHAAIDDYCVRFAERSGASCELRFRGRRRRLPSEMQLAIFRIIQECLTNAGKHAEAAKVEVVVTYDGDMVTLLVSDDGKGFDTSAKKIGHYGLTNIHERAKKFRGTVEIQSAPGAGTQIHVAIVIPLEGSHVQLMPQKAV